MEDKTPQRAFSYKNIKTHLGNLSLYLLASLISSGVSVAINPFLALNLSPEDYGIIGYYAGLSILFLPLISFSLHTYYTSKYFKVSKEKVEDIRNVVLSFQLLGGFVSLVLTLIIFNIYANSIDLSFAVFPYLYFSAFSVFFLNFYKILLIDKRLSGQPKSFFVFSMISLVVNVALAILLVVAWKQGAYGRMLGLCLSSLVSGAIALIHMKFKFNLNKKILKDALIFSWPMLFSAILYFVFGGFDRVMLERLNDTETLGLYNVAYQITAYVGVFVTAIIQTFEPNLFKATADANIKKALGFMGVIVAAVFIACTVFYFIAEPVINILTYGRYSDSIPYARVLVFRNVATAVAFVSSDIIIGLGFPKVELVNRIIGSLFAFFIFVYLIKHYTFFGAAWGQTITLLFMGAISMSFILYKLFIIKRKD